MNARNSNIKENFVPTNKLSLPITACIANYLVEMFLAIFPPDPISNIIKKKLLILRGAKVGNNPKFGRNLWIDGYDGLSIGNNVFINYGCLFQARGGISIGNDVLFGPGVTVLSADHETTAEACLRTSRAVYRPVNIGANSWIAARAVIAPGVTIGTGAIIACGAVVTKDVPGNTVVGGSPARIIKSRTDTKAPMS